MQTKMGTDGAFITGLIGTDAIVKTIPTKNGDKTITEFSIMAGNKFVDGERKAIWVRCTVWNANLQEITATIRKGDFVAATGTIKQNTYTNNKGVEVTNNDLDVDWVSITSKQAGLIHTDVDWVSITSKQAGLIHTEPTEPYVKLADVDLNIDEEEDGLPF